MAQPGVDVVIATRGARDDLLRSAIDSVLDQDYDGQVRVIVVYDVDQDPRPDLPVPGSASRSVSWVRNAAPHGPAHARNHGVAAGESPVIAFLDDDDAWLPDKLRRQVERLAEAPRAAVVGTGTIIDDQQRGRRTRRPAPAELISHAHLLRDRVAELHTSSLVMTREAFERWGGFETSLPRGYAEDYDLLLRLSRDGDVAMIREPLTLVRWTGGSYFFSDWQTIVDGLERLLELHPDLAADDVAAARVRGQIAFATAALGRRREAATIAREVAGRSPREPRWVLAALVAGGVPAERVQAALHRFGRGI